MQFGTGFNNVRLGKDESPIATIVSQLTGWRRKEVSGRSWHELFLPPELVDEARGIPSHCSLMTGAGSHEGQWGEHPIAVVRCIAYFNDAKQIAFDWQ